MSTSQVSTADSVPKRGRPRKTPVQQSPTGEHANVKTRNQDSHTKIIDKPTADISVATRLATAKPTAVNPTTKPATAELTAVNPTAKPATAEPEVVNPTTKPTTAGPTAVNPTTKPATAEPTVVNPTTKPATAKPTAVNPTAKPATAKPTVGNPTEQLTDKQKEEHTEKQTSRQKAEGHRTTEDVSLLLGLSNAVLETQAKQCQLLLFTYEFSVSHIYIVCLLTTQ